MSRIVMLSGQKPFGVVFRTLGFCLVITLMVSVVVGQYPKLGRPDLIRYGPIGLIGGTLPQIALFSIAGSVPTIIISIVQAAESLIVFAVAALIGLETPNLKRFFGLSLGLPACFWR